MTATRDTEETVHAPEQDGFSGTNARPWAISWTKTWPLVRYAFALGLVGLAIYVLAGQSSELSGTTRYLANIDWRVAGMAALLEAAAIVSFAMLQRRLLMSGGVRVPIGPITLITLAGNSVNNSLPAGPAFASVYAFRQYKFRGADDTLAAWTVLAETLCAAVALALYACGGLLIAGASGSSFNLFTDILAVLAVLVLMGAVVFGLLRRRSLVLAVAARSIRLVQRFTSRIKGDPLELAESFAQRLVAVRPTWPELAQAMFWALGNWVLDSGCLAVCFLALGAQVPWRGLILAYGGGQLAANLPLTPGGLGVVEGSLTIALVAFGGAEDSTVAAVILYRIISYWIALVVGWLAIAGLAYRNRVWLTHQVVS